MAHDSLVVLADGRVQTSRGLVQAIGDASGVEYESKAGLRRAAADWSQSIFCGTGNLVDGMALTYEDDDEMPHDTTARHALIAAAECLPRLWPGGTPGPASQAVLATVREEFMAGVAAPAWEVTTDWPQLQDCETTFKL